MWLTANPKELQVFLESATVYWEKNLRKPADDAVILVEAFHQDIRVTLRNLAFANALRKIKPARMIVFTGVEAAWRQTLWSGFDVGTVRQVCEAFGATETIDVWDIVRGHEPGPVDEVVTEYADATYCRLAKVPRLPADYPERADYRQRLAYAAALKAYYTQQFEQHDVFALVTSHVDYDQWGLAVEVARTKGVPIIHTQQTGCLKAYGLFPEHDTHAGTFREELTRQIGATFESQVWARREQLHDAAELIAWRAKVNLGRPSWWRGGATASVDMNNPEERARLRSSVVTRLGFTADKPVLTVFNHAVSDALGTNRELFGSLADWFAETAAWAAEHKEAQWLFLEHPSQALYDSTGFFSSLAKQYKKESHMTFRPSTSLSKNALWSLTDLGVTVRGSVSNELPAYGIPVIQAGWSEWSSCGLSIVVDDQEAYFKTLEQSISQIREGVDLVTAEQVERARLWLWLYRSGTDVVSPIVPQWEVWPADFLLRTTRATFRHVESDADPLFDAVARMWNKREPMLTRTDWSA